MSDKSHRSSSSSTSSSSAPSSGTHSGQYEQPYGNAAVQSECREHGEDQAPDSELGVPRQGVPASYDAAIARHAENCAMVDRLIRSALEIEVDPQAGANSRANLLRNTAQWIDQGQADLHVMTPVHDAEKRPGCPADRKAYFDSRKKYDESGATYDPTLDAAGLAHNDDGLEFKRPGVAGTMANDGVRMTLVDPAQFTESKVVAFFVHEVQHDCDQHTDGANWETQQPSLDPAALGRAPEWAYNSYQSEFRAYWMMNPEGSSADWFESSTDVAVTNFNITAVLSGADGAVRTGDDVSSTVSTAFSNKRQESIFLHMFGRGKADNVYYDPAPNKGWTKSYAYLPHYYAIDPAFKRMVDSYAMPVSGNLINSPRIQDLSDAMAGGGDIEPAMMALDELDIAYLSDRAQSQPFWSQALSDLILRPGDLWALSRHIGTNVPVGPYQETVRVVQGDTLGDIADRYLGDEARWRELYELNRTIIGGNPDLIIPGQELRLPGL